MQWSHLKGERKMLILLAVILGIAWVMGFTVFHVASGAIHLLVVLAIVSLIVHFVRRRGAPSV
jgi:CBS-domain-containing membrane protein